MFQALLQWCFTKHDFYRESIEIVLLFHYRDDCGLRGIEVALLESVDACRIVEGYRRTYKEIARVLDISEEQVKVNIFRARQTIKFKFQQYDNYGL